MARPSSSTGGSYPADPEYRFQVAASLGNIGNSYSLWNNDQAKAVAKLREAETVLAELQSRYPDMAKYSEYLSRTCSNLAYPLIGLGRIEESLGVSHLAEPDLTSRVRTNRRLLMTRRTDGHAQGGWTGIAISAAKRCADKHCVVKCCACCSSLDASDACPFNLFNLCVSLQPLRPLQLSTQKPTLPGDSGLREYHTQLNYNALRRASPIGCFATGSPGTSYPRQRVDV
jgi:hypothetical protein